MNWNPFRRTTSRKQPRPPQRKRTRSNLSVEQLEARVLMTVAPDKILGAVYKDLLQRPADTQGLQFWTGQMAHGASALQVVQQIEQSPEARQVEVRHLYTDLLGRKADGGGVDYFASQLQAGVPPASVEAALP